MSFPWPSEFTLWGEECQVVDVMLVSKSSGQVINIRLKFPCRTNWITLQQAKLYFFKLLTLNRKYKTKIEILHIQSKWLRFRSLHPTCLPSSYMKNFVTKTSVPCMPESLHSWSSCLVWEEGGNKKESKSKGSVLGYKGKECDAKEQGGRNAIYFFFFFF